MRARSSAAVLALAAVLVPASADAADLPFRSSIETISGDVRSLVVGSSWRQGCPVPLRDLRYVRVRHFDFRRYPRMGEIIVHRDVAAKVVRIFRRLYANGYQIRRMRLVDHYGASDFDSIEADNTSAFNCRYVDGTSRWSNHAYGRAIDINPIENPYVTRAGTTSHPASERYVDRSRRRHRAMILAGDATVRAFAAQGWSWGGSWSGAKDYQHFSANGR